MQDNRGLDAPPADPPNTAVEKDGSPRPQASAALIHGLIEGDRSLSLRESRDAFVTLANHVPQFVWMCTPEGGNIYFNQRWVDYTGLNLEESYGAGWNTPFHPDDKQAAWDAWSRALETGGFYQVESRLRAANGEYRWFLMQGEPLTDASGKVDRWFGTCTDIDDLKRAEQAILRSEKLASVSRMAASIAHEINNPLEAIANTLYLARSSADDPEEVRKYLDIAESELKRVAHITRQTLGFYRESTAPRQVSLNFVMDAAVDLLQGKIRVTQAVVEKQYDGEFLLTAVSGELRQVFANLLANSLDAIPTKGRISLRLTRLSPRNGRPACIRATVADCGTGIDPAILNHVFEPLFTTKMATGSGLGLWVAKQLVEKHGGSIRLRSRSTGPNRGTVVTVALPVECAAVKTPRPAQ